MSRPQPGPSWHTKARHDPRPSDKAHNHRFNKYKGAHRTPPPQKNHASKHHDTLSIQHATPHQENTLPVYCAPDFAINVLRHNCSRKRDPLSENFVHNWRYVWLTLIDRIGLRLGLAPLAIGDAMTLFHKFFLHYPVKDYQPLDIAMIALSTSLKLLDTPRKLRDIQTAAFQVYHGLAPTDHLDPAVLQDFDTNRAPLIQIEGLFLLITQFDYRQVSPTFSDFLALTHKFARHFSSPHTDLGPLAYLVALDSYKTLVHLSYPPHIVALACVYLASLLTPSKNLPWLHSTHEPSILTWDTCQKFHASLAEVHEISFTISSLFVDLCPNDVFYLIRKSTLPSPAQDSRLSQHTLRTISSLGIPFTFWGHVPLSVKSTDHLNRLAAFLRSLRSQVSHMDAPSAAPYHHDHLYDVVNGKSYVSFTYLYD